MFYLILSLFTQTVCLKGIYSWNFRCSAKEAVIRLLSWSILYIAFSKWKVSWFLFFYFDFSLFTQSVCLKGIYSWNFRCSVKEAAIFFLSWSTLYTDFQNGKFPDSCFLFWFPTVYPKCMFKRHLFLKLSVFRERSSDTFPFVEHPVYSIFKLYGVLIIVVLSWFAIIYPKCMHKSHYLLWIIFVDLSSALVAQISYVIFLYFGNFYCSVKKATLLLLAWLTLYIVLLRYSVS